MFGMRVVGAVMVEVRVGRRIVGFEDRVMVNVPKLFFGKRLARKTEGNALVLLIRSVSLCEGVVRTVLKGLRR
jgi:hypothetical protein